MKELSIFVDESGDFGPVSFHAPYYLVGLVFHEQTDAFNEHARKLDESFRQRGLESYLPVHSAPLIRREGAYRNIEGATRKKVFDTLFHALKKMDITHKVIRIDKRYHGCADKLEKRIARELGIFLAENLRHFQSYDRIVVYYDRGQKEVSRVLDLVFSAHLLNVEFKTVEPQKFILFQAADLACTMELVEARRGEQGLSKSESAFFGGADKFKKTYYRVFARQRFMGTL